MNELPNASTLTRDQIYKNDTCDIDLVTYPVEDSLFWFLNKLVPDCVSLKECISLKGNLRLHDLIPQHSRSGGLVVRKSNYPVDIYKGKNCVCMFQPISGNFSKSCTTHVFKNFIADFSEINLTVSRIYICPSISSMKKKLNNDSTFRIWVKH